MVVDLGVVLDSMHGSNPLGVFRRPLMCGYGHHLVGDHWGHR